MDKHKDAVIAGSDYERFIAALKDRVQIARLSASRVVYREMILLYWDIGSGIVEKQKLLSWGDSVVEQVAEDRFQHFCDKLSQNWAEGRFRQFGDSLSPDWVGARTRHFCNKLLQKYHGVKTCISSTRWPNRPPACITSRPRRGLAGPAARFLTRSRQARTSMLCWKRRRITSRLPYRSISPVRPKRRSRAVIALDLLVSAARSRSGNWRAG